MSQSPLQALFNRLDAPIAPSFSRRYQPAAPIPALPADAPVMHKVMRNYVRSVGTPYRVVTGRVIDVDQVIADLEGNARMDIAYGRYSATEEEIKALALAEATLYAQFAHDTLCEQWEKILMGSISAPLNIPDPPPGFVPPSTVTSGPRYDPTKP